MPWPAIIPGTDRPRRTSVSIASFCCAEPRVMPKPRRKVAQAHPQPKPPARSPTATADLLIMLGLVVAIFAVYSDVGRFDFTSYDDNLYVSENAHVTAGLTLESIKWAWTAVVGSNWMPVTLLSHMLDCQL